ncbi:Putative competence-damage inducible protein [Polystyrenella longa]|uniref:CinA-like protein n=1 Tax=Polystyrenella longa TaxID=2528007 RepID=A0A518CGR9_9PLAN|nr:molybdopterin-binding protein [Polystyrenella longa]QDU78426.1 Putative competence-damage inducible protein [Polystyrenella longa]
MHAEIIAIGSELTSGAKLDTNSQWLSQRLAEHGLVVRAHHTVADDIEELVRLLRSAAERSSLVLITGGLGPTLDDLTRQMMADMAGVDLEINEAALAHLQHLFSRRNITMPERNKVQALFPVGSKVVHNPIGTAPGIWMKADFPPHADIVALPGVPAEMKRMFVEEVLPHLPQGKRLIRHARVNCFGRGESTMEELLGELTARGRDPEVGITVHEATITLRINTSGETPEECEIKIQQTKELITTQLGYLVFGEEDQELEHIVVDLLNERHQTFATLELGTGGALANRIHDYMESPRCFAGGLIYPDMQRALTGLNNLGTESFSENPSLIEVAKAARDLMETDYLLAVSDWDRDMIESDDMVPDVSIVLIADGKEVEKNFTLGGDPGIYKGRVSKAILNQLRLHLLGVDADS